MQNNEKYNQTDPKIWRELIRKLKYDNLFYALTSLGFEVRKKLEDILDKINPIPK